LFVCARTLSPNPILLYVFTVFRSGRDYDEDSIDSDYIKDRKERRKNVGF